MLKKILVGLVVTAVAAVGAAAIFRDQLIAALMRPSSGFDAARVPAAPDYSKAAAWAAHPDHQDGADVVPQGSGLLDAQATAMADVFFVHPTTYLTGSSWNAGVDEGGTTRQMLEGGVLPYQASVFNGCCRVFAPRYRQAILAAFSDDGDDGIRALDLAYSDVRAAFLQFRKDNAGRPFLLAGHSQGTLHVERLLDEFMGTPELQELLAAYVVGYAIPSSLAQRVKTCGGPQDRFCMVGWRTLLDGVAARKDGQWVFVDGKYRHNTAERGPCVNPLTFTAAAADASTNKGSLRFGTNPAAPPPLLPNVTGARCDDGILRIGKPAAEGFAEYVMGAGDYHFYDYNLFYAAIREDAAARVGTLRTAPH